MLDEYKVGEGFWNVTLFLLRIIGNHWFIFENRFIFFQVFTQHGMIATAVLGDILNVKLIRITGNTQGDLSQHKSNSFSRKLHLSYLSDVNDRTSSVKLNPVRI